MTQVSGVLTQKPTSPEPTAGETRRFSLQQKPKRSGDGTFTKLKNESGDFGEPYSILKVDRLDDYTHPEHGTFHQFSILLESANGSQPQQGTGDRDDQINRAVAFKAATEIVAAQIQNGKLAPEGATEAIQSLTNALLPIVTGQGPTQGDGLDSGKTYDAPNNPGSNDDDIPF